MDLYNILAVDDEMTNLNALKRAFRHEYNVFSATNGQDALAIMEQNDMSVVIVDHRMPGMTGVEFLEKISQKYPDTIRILLTAYTDEKLLMDAINMGHVHSYMTKPWEPEEVKVVVREQLEEDREPQGAEEKTQESLVEYDVTQRVGSLEKALSDPDEGVRQKAAESLSRIEAKANFDTYLRMLDGDDRSARIQAIYLIAELGTQATIELLRLQMREAYDDVRAAVILALGNSSGNYRTREVREQAVDITLMGLEDVNLSIRASAANTLAKFKYPRSVDALLSAITSGPDDESESVQLIVNALLALGEIRDRAAVPEIMIKARSDNLEIKEVALKALGMIGDPSAEGCLIEALANDSAAIRMQAAESLGEI